MRKARMLGMLILLLSGPAVAQERRGWGYGFVAPGGMSNNGPTTLHVGGGGEVRVAGDMAVGGELGYLARLRDTGSSGLGLASLNASYHFGAGNQDRRVVPFVTGGGSVFFAGNGSTGGGNFGGGIQYWTRSRWGLRFEYRSHILSSDSPHIYEFRIGLAFR